jgi:hypothetical protein
MTIVTARRLAGGAALLGALGMGKPPQAQMGVGTWVRKATLLVVAGCSPARPPRSGYGSSAG